MQKSNTNQIIQGKATFKKEINEILIVSKEIRARLDRNKWLIGNLLVIEDYKNYQK